MTSIENSKALEELDHQLNLLAKQKGLPDCATYKQIKPYLLKVVALLDKLPSWLKPAWLNTAINAIKTLMAILDRVCA
jgi:hypothetical protein